MWWREPVTYVWFASGSDLSAGPDSIGLWQVAKNLPYLGGVRISNFYKPMSIEVEYIEVQGV